MSTIAFKYIFLQDADQRHDNELICSIRDSHNQSKSDVEFAHDVVFRF